MRILTELFDRRCGVAVRQHVMRDNSQLEKSLHANGNMEKRRVEVAVLVLEEIGFQEKIKARKDGVLGEVGFLREKAEFLIKSNLLHYFVPLTRDLEV